MRPGCVLLAAIYGSDRRATIKFDSQTWLTDVTPDMKIYVGTKEELDRLVEMTHERYFQGGKKRVSKLREVRQSSARRER
jgi:hypothetical protein